MPHIHDKIDYCSDVFIVNGDAVLLRMHEKYHMWLAPGGHIELDEDPVEAALREVKEETGLAVKLLGVVPSVGDDPSRELLLPVHMNRHSVSDTHEHISFAYYATSETRDTNPAPGEKRDGFKWFTKEELDDEKYGVPTRIRVCGKEALVATGLKK
jgi:ADP-ribose pyrophosphatase YjhB (NUDIX family)